MSSSRRPSGSCWSWTTSTPTTPASLYLAYPPAEAKRLWDKLEVHSTPKHGSWLNVAEIELGVLGGQCLDRRLADRESWRPRWRPGKRAQPAGHSVDWHFTTADARIKLKHLYPAIQD